MSETKKVSASADATYVMDILSYDVEVIIREDRKIEFFEYITMKANRSGSIFTRALPLEGDRYSNIKADCIGEESDFYYVETEEGGDYLNICCELFTAKGQTRIYEFSYVMEISSDELKDGMRLDIVGYGWTVPLYNVSMKVTFPAALSGENYSVFSDVFGEETKNEVNASLSLDGKVLTMQADVLNIVYSSRYHEYVAGGVTLGFTLPQGTLQNYVVTRFFTEDMWKIFLAVVVVIAISVGMLIFTRSKREMVTIVNIKAPDKMDPMTMGKWLDGTVDNEDVTSMIFYFAHEGFLKIDMTEEDDPRLIRLVPSLPENKAVHEKTIFNGLFKKGNEVRVSQIAGSFYDSMEVAKKQLLLPTMYEKKSVMGYVGGGIIGILLGFLTPFLMSFRVGGGYQNSLGIVLALPVVILLVLGYITENYRYKWKGKKRTAMFVMKIVVVLTASLFFSLLFARHLMTEWEKAVLCLGVFVPPLIMQGALSRTEEYEKTLGEILGFKDFIVVTEEEKIKFMLEENPELYYKVLPYAQVLGVTDEWENKFKKITMEPPSWCYSSNMSVFDCYIIHRSLNRAMAREIAREMSRRANQNGGGSRVGRSGGGGSFGGFGGGGHGGGGGSWR